VRLRVSKLRFGSSCIGVCAVGPEDRAHPNKLPFTGTLLIVDHPSDKPPHGSEGHLIYVPKAAAQKRLDTLINMGMNYQKDLSGHSPRHKVGVITGARIEGDKVLVNGFLWGRDFPEIKRDLSTGRLGMSMELQDVRVRDSNARVWYLEDFHFSGATILFKSAAAYTATSLAAAGAAKVKVSDLVSYAERFETVLAAALGRNRKGGRMKTEKKKRVNAAADNGQGDLLVKAITAGVAEPLKEGIVEAFKPFVELQTKQNASIARLAASVEELKAISIEAARHEDEDDMEAGHEEEEDMSAAHHDEDDEEDMAAAGKHGKHEDEEEEDDADEDEEELDAALEELEDDDAEEEPGEVNKDAENKGDKTTRSGKIGKAKKMAVKASSIQGASVLRELYASHRAMRKKYRTLKASAESKIEALQNQVEALEAQAEKFAEQTERRSIRPEVLNLLAKGGVDVREMRASGEKLTVDAVDEIFAKFPGGGLDPTTRMWFKNELLQANLLEQGEVHRGLN